MRWKRKGEGLDEEEELFLLEVPPPLTVVTVVVSPLPLELLLTDSLSDSPESGGVRASSPADAVGDSGWARGACWRETDKLSLQR